MYRLTYGGHRPYGSYGAPGRRRRNFLSRYWAERRRRYNARRRVRRYGRPRRRPRPRDRDRDFRRVERERESSSEEEEPEPEPVEEKELETQLHVKNVDLHIEKNTNQHHTDEYECTKDDDPELVIRRGDEFRMTVEFDRPYVKEDHDLSFVFQLDNKQVPRKKTMATFELEENGPGTYRQEKTWGAKIIGRNGNAMTVAVYVPPDCPIGEWEFIIKTEVERDGEEPLIWQYQHKDDITILFNPWCRDDEVYMSTNHEEYILNDNGIIFTGNYRQIGSKPWSFGQFEKGILDAALYLVRKGFSYNNSASMGNAVMVSRIASRMVNDADDNGVLSGRWDGKYEGGTRPTAWTGSVKILKQYMSTKKPVRYGQCWVFSGVLTTVCRAIGIPCRSVTNFMSAHDSDVTLTIDRVFDEDLDPIPESSDSVWNFHVWNEVWIERSDIGPNYGGWQVIDSTPQEASDGVYCCGPCPVVAIRKGEVDKGYDGRFVFAEVNSDEIYWMKQLNGEYKVLKIFKEKNGKRISTHTPTGVSFRGETRTSSYGRTNDERDDITLQYKYHEGSDEERRAVHLASTFARIKYKTPYVVKDPGVELEMEAKDDIMVGEDFTYSMTVKNTSRVKRTLVVTMTVTSLTYSGVIKEVFVQETFHQKVLGPNQSEQYTIKVNGTTAVEKTGEGFAMRVGGMVRLLETGLRAVDEVDFRFRRPDLVLDGPKECRQDETIRVKISFTNPLSTPLTQCSLDLDGTLLRVPPTGDNMTIPDIGPGRKLDVTVNLKPKRGRKKFRDLSVSLDCEELPDIVGTYNIFIKI